MEIQTLDNKLFVPISRVGYFGNLRDRVKTALFGLFGNEYLTAYHFEGNLIGKDDALKLYEESYFKFLETNPEIFEWLVNTASDVYDNCVSNVNSGLDYSVQECKGTHLQDIAIRRALNRLDKKFKGRKLVEVRGRDSEGYALSPGQVPFIKPKEILKPTRKIEWVKEGTIEDFWQSNKLLIMRRKYFNWLSEDGSINPPNGSYNLSNGELKTIQPVFCEFGKTEPRIYAIGTDDELERYYAKIFLPYTHGEFMYRRDFFNEIAKNFLNMDFILRLGDQTQKGTIKKLRKFGNEFIHFSVD